MHRVVAICVIKLDKDFKMNKIYSIINKANLSFMLIVAAPTVLAGIYYGVVASDRYVSESSFVVRSPQKTTSASGLSAFLQNVGFSRSADDSYVVNDFILSRDAVNGLQKSLNIESKYSSDKVDLLSRFNPIGISGGAEMFYEYYKNKVNIVLDSASSISTLTVKAYTAEDAYKINQNLLEQAENLVNKLNERGRKDMLATSEENVKKSEEQVLKFSAQMAEYRAKNQVFDIDKQANIQMQLVSKLQDQLIMVQTQLAQISLVTPENPQIEVLKEREASLKQEISKETKKALGGSGDSLSQKAVEYEKLSLEKDFASKQLASALATLEQSKAEAARKQLYLERISEPNKPDRALEPARLKNFISVFLISLVLWAVYLLLSASVREHKN